MTRRDAIVIGGGLNGLVAAAFLAKRGIKPVVLERAPVAGGCVVTSEIAPGVRAPVLAHRVNLDPAIVRLLGLERHGLEIVRPPARVFAPLADGRALTLWNDAARAAETIAPFSTTDASRYPAFLAAIRAVSGVLQPLLAAPPASLDHPRPADLFELLKAGRRFRALARADAYRLLRWLPMPVADLVREWFTSEPLCAALAASGVLGSFLGPRSAGSGAVMLLLSAADAHPLPVGWTVRGGIGRVADALAAAASAAGAHIRTGAEVSHIIVRDGAAVGVALESGEEISAGLVVSSADPRRTLLDLVDPIELSPEFLRRVQHIRMRGTLAKVNYVVAQLPVFSALQRSTGSPAEAASALSGCVRLAPTLDAIEKAFDAVKYGELAEDPWIELAFPSLQEDGTAASGRHVVSGYVQFVPYASNAQSADALRTLAGRTATRTIEQYAPGFESSILAQQVITPWDLEREFGLTGGHIFHGELALDQLMVARPLLGWARYRTPIRNLWLCGSGTHPGTGADGRAGLLAARAIARGD